MKSWMPQAVAVVLALAIAAFAGGYFLGRATVSPGTAVVVTERAAPAQKDELASPGEVEAEQPAEPSAEEERAEEKPVASEAAHVDINTADMDELETLPGIGPKIAERIVAYRTENGPFTTVEELREVSGIGEKVLEQIRERIVAGG